MEFPLYKCYYCAHKRNGAFTRYALICHSEFILTEKRQFEKPFLEGFLHFAGNFHYTPRTNRFDEDTALKKIIALTTLLALLMAALPALAHTRDEVRAAYALGVAVWQGDSPYAEPPAIEAPYAAGALAEGARREALGLLNFARWLAGVSPVEELPLYNFSCQHGAVLLAALDYVDHDAPCPDDMEPGFYESAHIATGASNIARLNWMRPTILREGVEYFLRDDGEENLAALGHRRWALTPEMAATGFGLANSAAGNSYVVMYAHDLSAEAAWDHVAWPAPGAFPAELMHDHLAWSVMLNPESYDLAASEPVVTLKEERLGLSYAFHPAAGEGDGFCALSLEGYGSGPCLIFRPDFTGDDFTDYQQNQVWTVKAEGLVGADGTRRTLEYRVEMVSLTVQDAVNVELSPLEAALEVGETLRLTADVIPAYADDLSVAWRSTDEAVAIVDAGGAVRAVGPGACEIVAACAGGHEDRCAVTVR